MKTDKLQVTADGEESLGIQSCSQSSSSLSDVLQVITKGLEKFEAMLIDSELKLERIRVVDRRVEEVLTRQWQGGLLSYIEYINFNHVKHLWVATLNLLATHYLRDQASKRQILANLVDLHTLNEIGRDQLLDIITQL